ncbi:MAG: PHP domain-containing protein [Pseudomonadota bacterium]
MSLFIHLHLHSAYSLSEGAIHIGALKDLCLEHRMPAVAVTDTNNLFAALEASETLSGAGVQPITGVELAVAPGDCGLPDKRGAAAPGVVLLAQNRRGYERLMKLASRAFLEPAFEDAVAIGLDDLLTETNGLVLLTGGPKGPVDRLIADGREGEARALLQRMKDAFGDRLYVELQRHGLADERRVEPALVEAAYALDLPLVATNEPYFRGPEDHEAHDALLCIATASGRSAKSAAISSDDLK